MNITLITPTPPDINAFGIRTISAVLKREGHRVKTIFLPGGIEHLKFDAGFVYQYTENILQQIIEICSGAELVGFSFMSQYFDRAHQVTKRIKEELNTTVVWGGTHPIHRPEECINYADIICTGEGEIPVVELVSKMEMGKDYTDTQGFWFRANGDVKKMPHGQLVHNLDDLPFFDYDIEDHFVYEWYENKIVPVTPEVLKKNFPRLHYYKDRRLIAYRTMTSRGCPHRCSYCASSAMLKLRRRSVDNVMKELESMLTRFNFIEAINFFDDTFFAAPVSYFAEFAEKYKNRIGLPFYAQGSANTMSENKLKFLLDAGLIYTEMGIQTGSERIKKMYRRQESNAKIIGVAELLSKYKSQLLPPDYHVILDNPWETKEDVLDTLRLLLKLPGPFELQVSSLVFFPGTELNERAKAEGIIKDELREVYRKPFTFPKATYLNYLIYLSGFPAVPRWFLRFLSCGFLVNILHSQSSGRPYTILFHLTDKLRLMVKGVIALFTGDFNRITNYFKLAR